MINSIKLKILYGVEQEIQRVGSTLKKLPWYMEQGYKPHLPEGITVDSSDADIANAVQSEYVEEDYVENAKKLQEEWIAIPARFEKMREVSSFNLKNEYGVLLTKYGVGGSYDVEASRVILKISANKEISRVGTLTHEIVHMTIQYLIDQYHVRHWRKERLVDLLMGHYFPGLAKIQNIKEDVSVVDYAFKKLFPEIEAVVKSI